MEMNKKSEQLTLVIIFCIHVGIILFIVLSRLMAPPEVYGILGCRWFGYIILEFTYSFLSSTFYSPISMTSCIILVKSAR